MRIMMWLRFLSSSRPGSCKCFDKSVDITCVVVKGERDPNASATYSAHNIMTTKAFHHCLYAFVRVSQGNDVWRRSRIAKTTKRLPTILAGVAHQHCCQRPCMCLNSSLTQGQQLLNCYGETSHGGIRHC